MNQVENSAFRILDFDDAEAGILAYRIAEGQMSEEDAAPIWKRFEDAKARGTKVRIYCEYEAAPSVTARMVFDKIKRLGTILSTLERMAIVGDKGWMAIYEKIVDPITKADIRHFANEQRDEALDWIRE